MVVRTATITSEKDIIVTSATTKRDVTLEAIISTNDTIPITSVTTLLGAALMKKSDGSACTCTLATNIITVTQAALTDVPIIGLAYGTP